MGRVKGVFLTETLKPLIFNPSKLKKYIRLPPLKPHILPLSKKALMSLVKGVTHTKVFYSFLAVKVFYKNYVSCSNDMKNVEWTTVNFWKIKTGKNFKVFLKL